MSNYPEGLTAYDRAYIEGDTLVPTEPFSEKFTFADDVIYFDYVVLPDGPFGDYEVRVEICGMIEGAVDFERVVTFESVDAATDYTYSFDQYDTYHETKEAIQSDR